MSCPSHLALTYFAARSALVSTSSLRSFKTYNVAMDRISCSYHNQAETLFDVNTEFVQICRYKMEVHLPTPITICNS